jgi:hypothetical protein
MFDDDGVDFPPPRRKLSSRRTRGGSLRLRTRRLFPCVSRCLSVVTDLASSSSLSNPAQPLAGVFETTLMIGFRRSRFSSRGFCRRGLSGSRHTSPHNNQRTSRQRRPLPSRAHATSVVAASPPPPPPPPVDDSGCSIGRRIVLVAHLVVVVVIICAGRTSLASSLRLNVRQSDRPRCASFSLSTTVLKEPPSSPTVLFLFFLRYH